MVPRDMVHLHGQVGVEEKLRDGSSVLVDDNYIRESIVNPNARIVAGYEAYDISGSTEG